MKMYYRVYFLKYITLIIYTFIVFFEIPGWCLNNDNIKNHYTWDDDIYPNSGLPKMHQYASRTIEILCLIILLLFTFFRRSFRVLTRIAFYREITQTVLTVLGIIDIVIALARDRGLLLGQFIRIILVIVFIRSLREAIKRIALVLYDAKEILLLIIAYIMLFGWIGYRLFMGTQEGEQYFMSMSEGMWSMLVLLTTANFPDVMIPAYSVSKFYALFFVIYIIIGLFFLLNLVLAVYYFNYKNRVENNIKKFIDIREEFLLKKFHKFDHNQKGFLTKQEWKELLTELLSIGIHSKKKVHVSKIAK